jgi:hypothetical protein
VLDRRCARIDLAEDKRRAADRFVRAVQRADDRAREGRLAGAEGAAQRDDVARPQRARESVRVRLERRAVVEDVIRRSQNSVWCFCG